MENVDTAVYFSFSMFNLSATTVVIDSLQLTFPRDATVFVGVSLIGSNATCFGRKNDRDYSGLLISILQNRAQLFKSRLTLTWG